MQNSKLAAALEVVIAMAEQHVEDIQLGLEDGTYDRSENTDLAAKEAAIAVLRRPDVLVLDAKTNGVCAEIVGEMLATYAHAFEIDEEGDVEEAEDTEINGGDAVEMLSDWIVRAMKAQHESRNTLHHTNQVVLDGSTPHGENR